MKGLKYILFLLLCAAAGVLAFADGTIHTTLPLPPEREGPSPAMCKGGDELYRNHISGKASKGSEKQTDRGKLNAPKWKNELYIYVRFVRLFKPFYRNFVHRRTFFEKSFI
jgi:hypothetical protein